MKEFKVTIYPFKPILSLGVEIADAEEIARIREMCASDDPSSQLEENDVWSWFNMKDLFYGCDSLCITDMETGEDVFSIDDISSLEAETFVLEKFSAADMNPGEYTVRSLYDGKDYFVEDLIDYVYVGPSMTYESSVRVGDKNVLYFEVPEKCKGRISVKIGSKKYSATIKDGYAVIDLSKLPLGDWDLDVKYVGADGFKESYYVGVYVDYAPVKIKALSTKVAYNDDYKVKVIGRNGKVIKNAKVTFKINGKKVKTLKTDSKGIAKFRIPAKYAPKKYTITAVYKKTKMSKKVSVRHAVALKTTKVKKSSRLILKAKVNNALKSKRVTFKFNGKTYHAKVNSKGIAKVTLKKSALANLKVGGRVKLQATCLKDTVKKSLKVKK